MRYKRLLVSICLLALLSAACAKKVEQTVELRAYPLDSLDGVVTQDKMSLDTLVSSDGNGSLRVSVSEPTVVLLFETGDLDIENARLVYGAQVRTEGVQGQVYLEMWCRFPARGEFFSRGLTSPLTGTTNWTTQETSFFMKKGENPDNVKLNLVIDGEGTAWIDDVHLLKAPLE